MNIMGLDLSMTASGVALPNDTSVTLVTRPGDGDRRLDVIAQSVRHYAQLHQVDLVVMEEAPPGLKGPAIKAIHMVHGAVRLELVRLGIPYAVVNPSTLKLFATGKKGAGKPEMAVEAYKRARREFPDDNQCDAFWLQQAGEVHYDRVMAAVVLPKAQEAALHTVQWPVLQSGPAAVAS